MAVNKLTLLHAIHARGLLEAVPKFGRELGRVPNFKQLINWHLIMKDHVEIGHLTKYEAFRVNGDKL